MVYDGNGTFRLSFGNWVALLILVCSGVGGIAVSHYTFAVAIHREIATISGEVKSNQFRIGLNASDIKDNEKYIKELSREH